MARIVLNPALQIVSGQVGDFVYRHQPDGSVTLAQISLPKPGYQPSPAQAAQRNNFKVASVRYRRLLQDPGIRAAYEWLLAARGPMARLHALVISDIMKPPIIKLLDLSAYHGAAGGSIDVRAEDNVAVARLALSIYDLVDGREVECAEKNFPHEQLAAQVAWLYTAGVDLPAGHTAEVRVTAWDLAENRVELVRAL